MRLQRIKDYLHIEDEYIKLQDNTGEKDQNKDVLYF